MHRDLDQFQAKLKQIVRKICPVELADDIDDLVQISTLRIWRILEGEGNQPPSSSYLWKVAHSVLIDEIRKVRRRKEVKLDDVKAVEHVASGGENPEGSAVNWQSSRAIRDCLSFLAESRRRAVTAYLLGHTVPQTARLLGWHLKKTESLVYRGLKQLRECLRSKGISL